MTLLLFYLFLALGVSFLCSLVEAGILSLSRSHVALLVKQNVGGAERLQALKRNIDRPLAAILTLNTIAHTVGAAGVGAQSQTLFGSAWVAATSAVLTLLVLVLSEIIPKTLGAVYALRLATFTAYTIDVMIVVTYPLVIAFQAFSNLLAGQTAGHRLSREEIALVAEIGAAEGALNESEHRIIRNALYFDVKLVKSVMTPRTVVFMAPRELSVRQMLEQHAPLRFSRIPIFGKGPDDISGVVLRHEIYEAARLGQAEQRLERLAAPIHAVPEVAPVSRVLDEFLKRREHLFLVVDEFGGAAGIITLEDAIETLLGAEIVDETDRVADMRQIAASLFRRRLAGLARREGPAPRRDG